MNAYPLYDGGIAPMTRLRFLVPRVGDPRFKGCISQAGVRRARHEPDKDGVCVFCSKGQRRRRS